MITYIVINYKFNQNLPPNIGSKCLKDKGFLLISFTYSKASDMIQPPHSFASLGFLPPINYIYITCNTTH